MFRTPPLVDTHLVDASNQSESSVRGFSNPWGHLSIMTALLVSSFLLVRFVLSAHHLFALLNEGRDDLNGAFWRLLGFAHDLCMERVLLAMPSGTAFSLNSEVGSGPSPVASARRSPVAAAPAPRR